MGLWTMNISRRNGPMFGRTVLRLTTLAAVLLAASLSWRQINRGVIEGVVSDPAGAVVADAEVTVTSVDTNTIVPARTNATGYYRAGDLVPGKYTALIKAPGFSTLDLRNIEVSGGSVTRVDAQLRIDATSQTIQVNAEAPLIDSSASNVSTTVENAIIQDVPLQGRDLQQLTFLIPGVNNVGGPPGSNFGFNSQFGTFPDPSNALGSNVAVNGGQGGANAWYLDGSLNLSSFAENVV